MTETELLAIEAERFVKHVHDFADSLAGRLLGMSQAEAETPLDKELVRLAVRRKDLEAKTGAPEVTSIGYNVSAVVRTRVAELLERPRCWLAARLFRNTSPTVALLGVSARARCCGFIALHRKHQCTLRTHQLARKPVWKQRSHDFPERYCAFRDVLNHKPAAILQSL